MSRGNPTRNPNRGKRRIQSENTARISRAVSLTQADLERIMADERNRDASVEINARGTVTLAVYFREPSA